MFNSMARMTGLFLAFTLAAAAHSAAARDPYITSAVDEHRLVMLANNVRPEVTPENDRGPVPDAFPLKEITLLLRRTASKEAALERFLEQQTDRTSSNYHRWLTAREFGERFGAAVSDIATLSRWLAAKGFHLDTIAAGRRTITFSGSAGQVRAAFHTELHRFKVGGADHFANVSAPRMPATLARAVIGIVSLNDFMPRSDKVKPDYTFNKYGKSWHVVVPEDLATIYNLNPLFADGVTGNRATIAVIEDSDVANPNDWSTFRSTFGLSRFKHASLTLDHPIGAQPCDDPGLTGAESDATLDAQWASAAAPDAAIIVASCKDTVQFGGFLAIENLINGDNPPEVMSLSYSQGEAWLGEAYNQYIAGLYQQAAAEGVSLFVSAGDEGPAENDARADTPTHGISVSGFTSTPYNVSVGGTDFADSYLGTVANYWNASNDRYYGSAKSYIPEFPWDDSCANRPLAKANGYTQTSGADGYCNQGGPLTSVAGSGGPSGCASGTPSIRGVVSGTCAGYRKPKWQALLGVPHDHVRDVPDVALFAANGLWGHYYLYCDSAEHDCNQAPSNWSSAGGTSFGAPIWAGFQALTDQQAGGRQGNPNPVLYQLAAAEYGADNNSLCRSSRKGGPDASCVFYDVTIGDNDVNCLGGYDCYLPSGTNGVLSKSDSRYRPSFVSRPGYDFPSGIGTVNVANLVNAWPK
ncbi:MAG TPA: protease pro-enzyme activation domain-containing protein [Rhizomicrobium sp.]|nr:protease pro-enzyme activation domain-containing protein [Rhizomicrobium sp.]